MTIPAKYSSLLIIALLLTSCAPRILVTTEVHGRLKMAQVLYKDGDIAAACYQFEVIFKEYLQSNPDSVKMWRNLSLALFIQDKHDEAIASYREVLHRKPRSAQYLFEFGTLQLEMGDTATAQEYFEKALAVSARYTEALNSLGFVYIEQGRVDEGFALVQKAYRRKPDAGHILDSMGWGYYHMRRYEDALEYLLKAAEKRDTHVVQGHLAAVYTALGDKQQAVAHQAEAEKLKAVEKTNQNVPFLRDIPNIVGF